MYNTYRVYLLYTIIVAVLWYMYSGIFAILLCILDSWIYGIAQFKLDRKSRVVMRAHVMRVISLAFSSVSTRKFTCTKILAGRFCVNTRVPIKAPCVCLACAQKQYSTSQPMHAIFLANSVKNIPLLVTKHYFKCMHIVLS